MAEPLTNALANPAGGAAPPPLAAARPRAPRGEWLLQTILMLLLALCVAPLLLMVNLALKSEAQFQYARWAPSLAPAWENFSAAWPIVRGYLLNTVLASGGAVFGVVALSAAGGYAFSRSRFPGKEVLYLVLLSALMIPGILYLVPKFVLFRDLHLINTRWALWLSYWAEGQVFGVFLFRTYLDSLPSDLYEAPEIDGAGPLRAFIHIALPLSKPIVGTVAVMNILFTWNDLIWPWIAISNADLATLSVGMSLFQRTLGENWGPLFAGMLIASVPLVLLFIATSKHFISGLISGAFKA